MVKALQRFFKTAGLVTATDARALSKVKLEQEIKKELEQVNRFICNKSGISGKLDCIYRFSYFLSYGAKCGVISSLKSRGFYVTFNEKPVSDYYTNSVDWETDYNAIYISWEDL